MSTTLTDPKATTRTPQIVTLVIDDSNSMREPAGSGKNKAQVATESIQDIIITAQCNTQGSRAFRYLLNIAKFGDSVTPMAEASAPMDVNLDLVTFEGNSGWTNKIGRASCRERVEIEVVEGARDNKDTKTE